jgi:hypothetical protein
LRKRSVLLIAAGSLILLAALLAVLISRERVRRHRVFRAAQGETRVTPPATIPPVDQWSETFATLPPDDLNDLLENIRQRHGDLYAKWSLAYLHARSLLEDNETDEAVEKLRPFLADKRFADLALYHQSEIEDAAENAVAASQTRQKLILEHPNSIYREQAIEEEADYLSSVGDSSRLTEFTRRVTPSVDTRLRRDLNARVVETMLRTGNNAAGFASAMAVLGGGTTDDAADRISRALDRPEIVQSMSAEQRALLGETFQSHRHYDRAVALLTAAAPGLPAKSDEIQFAIGRSHFGAERYAEAQAVYLRGANTTKDPRWKATFFFHASRAVQLQGNDREAERLMTAAVAVPGRFPATTAALTQRLRTRAKQKRMAEAAADLALLRKIAPNDRAVLEGSLAYALAMLAAGNSGAALSALNSLPAKMLDPYDVPEHAYWRARALEASNPRAAFSEYLKVLRAKVPTHFAYFARQRLDSAAMAPKLEQELRIREAQVTNLIAAKQFALAKDLETDRILLSSMNREPELKRLTSIYQGLPPYKTILELTPEPLPKFPIENTSDRAELLIAMGLYDEATDDIPKRFPLRPVRSALTQAVALNRGNASRESIYAVEILMKSVPNDFVPDLLPQTVRRLLYPRYFFNFIESDARRFNADPTLVLSIMREESRFNPRAKSQAAARGLLQFIITTARDIGRNIGLVDVAPEDLYDPRIIISLGARYVSELSQELGGNHYRTAAAYNAGPKQVALWTRLAPAAGDDWFLSSINFDETKGYVRKVMNSYMRYNEIYGKSGPVGGVRIEP